MNNGIINEINGCISTGKEANVYHAVGPNDKEFAIKIYKTSILVFKDRERYVAGEFRYLFISISYKKFNYLFIIK